MPDQIELAPYKGTWTDDDPDAGFRSMVTMFSNIDPLPTLDRLSQNKQIPVGALARFILARYAASGSEALMEIGPRVIGQMNDIVENAETLNTDQGRLKAYDSLAAIVSWLNVPLTDPDSKTGEL
ncbi:MAG: DUF6027 family protein [Dehalococcoidia bacterium]